MARAAALAMDYFDDVTGAGELGFPTP